MFVISSRTGEMPRSVCSCLFGTYHGALTIKSLKKKASIHCHGNSVIVRNREEVFGRLLNHDCLKVSGRSSSCMNHGDSC
jgi:hypothetical protein